MLRPSDQPNGGGREQFVGHGEAEHAWHAARGAILAEHIPSAPRAGQRVLGAILLRRVL
jgi:hypothetical protein